MSILTHIYMNINVLIFHILQKFGPCFAEGSTDEVAVVAEAGATVTEATAEVGAEAATKAEVTVAAEKSRCTISVSLTFTLICEYHAHRRNQV